MTNTIEHAALREPDRVGRSDDGRTIRYQWILSSKADEDLGNKGVAEILAELRVDYEPGRGERGLDAILHNRETGRYQVPCHECKGAGCARCEQRGFFTMVRETIHILAGGGVRIDSEELRRFSQRRLDTFAEESLARVEIAFARGDDAVLRYFDHEEES